MTRAGAVTRWMREAVSDNLGLKLVSLVFSLGFYLYLNGAQTAQRSFPVSVVVLLPRDAPRQILLTQPPAQVRATIHGARPVLDELKSEDLGTVQLDLREGTPSFAPFDTSSLELPPGLNAELDPPGIDLNWDDIVTRDVPIQTSVTGQPLAGFAVVGQPSADPRVVVAQGPKSVVDTLQNTHAESFDVGGLGEGLYTRKLALGRPPARVTFDVDTTTVIVEVGRARLDRLVLERPLHVLGLAHATTAPAFVDAKVVGPPELVNVLRPEQIVPVIDLRATHDLGPHGTTTATALATVEGCTVELIPSTVVVKW